MEHSVKSPLEVDADGFTVNSTSQERTESRNEQQHERTPTSDSVHHVPAQYSVNKLSVHNTKDKIYVYPLYMNRFDH